MAWIMQGNRPVNTGSVTVPGTPFVGDSPYTFWRIDPNANNGRPYQGLMIGIPVLEPPPPVVVPELYYGSVSFGEMYFGSRKVASAFWGEEQVF